MILQNGNSFGGANEIARLNHLIAEKCGRGSHKLCLFEKSQRVKAAKTESFKPFTEASVVVELIKLIREP